MFEDLMRSLFAPILKKMDEQTAEIKSFRVLLAKWLLPAPVGELRVTLTLEEDGSMNANITLPPLPSSMPTGLRAISRQNLYVRDMRFGGRGDDGWECVD